MTQSLPAAVDLPTREVEELVRTLVKGLRAFQMYLPNNPIYHRAVQAVRGAFQPLWQNGMPSLVLQIVETDITWEDQTVYHQPNKAESFAWGLFKDGMRVLTLFPGVEDEEIVKFLEVVQKARTLPTDSGDDLLTLLWEQEFSLVQYHFTEFMPDAGIPGISGEGVYSQDPPQDPNAIAEANRGKLAEEAPPRKSAVVDVEDFDSTLYWLDEAEIRSLAEHIEREYKQDLRNNVLNIVFDVFEQRNEDWARAEVMGTLESYLPHVLNAGDFKAVAQILRETRLLVRKPDLLTPNQRDRLDALTGRLSDPQVLQQVLTSVTEAQIPPSAEHLGEVFRELRPAALETALVWLPRVPVNAPIHELLASAADRLAETSPQEVLRLLRLPQSEALPAVIAICGRLRVQGAVPGLADTLRHESPALRAAAVMSLDAIGTAAALQSVEAAVDDSDREVRIAAVQALGKRGNKAVLKRIEPVIQGKAPREMDLTERMRFFEAYAMISGASALETLATLIAPGSLFRRKESPEVRACAALALGRLKSPEAREVLQKHRDDKELIVRNAVSKSLREMGA